MTTAAASLDAVDRAFLWHQDRRRGRPARSPEPAATHAPPIAAGSGPVVVRDDGVGSLVDRLLRIVPQDFERLADRVERAHEAGAEVIAITGARRGEGRTTLVECVARTLAMRGRRIECHDREPLVPVPSGRHGSTIVLVDSGVWFPPGPLRRSWLERQSLGCHAVVLVRRADQPACEARGRLLESLGLRVLGEVLTMAPTSSPGLMVS